MNNQFSENLKKIRKENNLSQEQLADCLGVSRQAISKWESGSAYPEMDKIIALCDKFNVNIDDLLHKDIKEVKGEEESKKKINNIVEDFLGFITNTINLFSSMSFKSKVKCLFEQVIIAVLLFLMSLIVSSVFKTLFSSLFGFLPFKAYSFIYGVFNAVLVIALLVTAIIIMSHIFKTRYLDYYDKVKEEATKSCDDKNEEVTKDEKVNFKKVENKIVIRDPKHSEYKFVNALFKIIVGIIKFFLLCFGLFVAFMLVFLFGVFIISFLLYKTGFFFIGLIMTILSSAVITIVILLLIINFVFNRKNNKKKMIWSFILALIVFGIGCGFISVGTLSFDIVDNNSEMVKVVTKEYDMEEDLIFNPYDNRKIEYIEADNNNIKVEYLVNKYCMVDDDTNHGDENIITAWSYCNNPMKYAREVIRNINDKKIISLDNDIVKINVYTTKENIDKLNANWDNHLKKIESREEEMQTYENRMDDLEEENAALRKKVNDLESELENTNN